MADADYERRRNYPSYLRALIFDLLEIAASISNPTPEQSAVITEATKTLDLEPEPKPAANPEARVH